MKLFIGHEWLKKHNPNVDWQTCALMFDRCPTDCNYIMLLNDLESNHDHEQVSNVLRARLEEGERFFALNMYLYTINHVVIDKGGEQLSLNPLDLVFEE